MSTSRQRAKRTNKRRRARRRRPNKPIKSISLLFSTLPSTRDYSNSSLRRCLN